MIVQDRGGNGYAALANETNNLIGKANQTPGLANVFTFFDPTNPRVFADIDRAKANALGVPPERVFEALQVYLGSAFVNDFNLLGRTYRVTAQADAAIAAAADSSAQVVATWAAEAEKELRKIPFFVRGKARRNTETYARDKGLPVITLETLYDAKAHFSR